MEFLLSLLSTQGMQIMGNVIALVTLIRTLIPDEIEAKFPWFTYPLLDILIGLGLGYFAGIPAQGALAGLIVACGYKAGTLARDNVVAPLTGSQPNQPKV